jgi:hypothetical protein
VKRALALRKESLHELGSDELRGLVGGAYTDTCLETLKLNCITGPFTMDLCPTFHCTQITT